MVIIEAAGAAPATAEGDLFLLATLLCLDGAFEVVSVTVHEGGWRASCPARERDKRVFLKL
ncbi:hypothetical protein DDF67_13100 [Caulobacter endophyticus]|uniref:Uncharacterized protein n=1 Tax=Caulobacter endophyticus TaxID=2172652 RepID=A0A2T9JY01_9CAUL|nr:hypothetical protein DDF67_13100 [Caulobacter endophyticus]